MWTELTSQLKVKPTDSKQPLPILHRPGLPPLLDKKCSNFQKWVLLLNNTKQLIF